MRRHAWDLARAFGIRIIYDPKLSRDEAAALWLQRCVYVRPIDDETSYLTVIHEIGHFAAPNGFARDVAVSEAAAWEWAEYYVKQVFEWTAAMEMTKRFCVETYRRGR